MSNSSSVKKDILNDKRQRFDSAKMFVYMGSIVAALVMFIPVFIVSLINSVFGNTFFALLGASIGLVLNAILCIIVMKSASRREDDFEESKLDYIIEQIDYTLDSQLSRCKELENSTWLKRVAFPESNTMIHKRISEILAQGRTSLVRIICYGTNGFGGTIDDILHNYSNIRLQVVVCDPSQTVFMNEEDKPRLIQTLRKMIDFNNVEVYIAGIPPTIRAAYIADDKDNAIWCSMQTYIIDKSLDGSGSYTLEGDFLTPTINAEESNKEMMDKLRKIFDKEFERLSNAYGERLDKAKLERIMLVK